MIDTFKRKFAEDLWVCYRENSKEAVSQLELVKVMSPIFDMS